VGSAEKRRAKKGSAVANVAFFKPGAGLPEKKPGKAQGTKLSVRSSGNIRELERAERMLNAHAPEAGQLPCGFA
jgi:hypothetical protein